MAVQQTYVITACIVVFVIFSFGYMILHPDALSFPGGSNTTTQPDPEIPLENITRENN